jgi:hypothetical protein
MMSSPDAPAITVSAGLDGGDDFFADHELGFALRFAATAASVSCSARQRHGVCVGRPTFN